MQGAKFKAMGFVMTIIVMLKIVFLCISAPIFLQVMCKEILNPFFQVYIH